MTPEQIDAMVAAGLSPEQMAALIKHELEAEARKKAEKRAKDAARKRKQRHAESRDVTRTECDITGQSVTQPAPYTEDAHTHAEPEPNKTTYPTTSEANASSVGPQPADLPLTGELILPIAKPKPPASSRGCRLPPGFPGEDEREWTQTNLGFSDDDFDECAAEFRDYWSGVPGQRGVKCDWPATFRNGARKFRPRRGARQAHPAGDQRSDGSLLGAYQRAAARTREANAVSQRRPGIFDHGSGELEMRYGIPAE